MSANVSNTHVYINGQIAIFGKKTSDENVFIPPLITSIIGPYGTGAAERNVDPAAIICIRFAFELIYMKTAGFYGFFLCSALE